MKVGGRYNWKNQPERLVYIGRNLNPGQSRWHQFEKVDKPGVVWCEVLDTDLHRIEETPPADGVKVRNPTQQEDRFLREAAKRSSKVVDPGRLAPGVGTGQQQSKEGAGK